jgi:hypothetical protein
MQSLKVSKVRMKFYNILKKACKVSRWADLAYNLDAQFYGKQILHTILQ